MYFLAAGRHVQHELGESPSVYPDDDPSIGEQVVGPLKALDVFESGIDQSMELMERRGSIDVYLEFAIV
jgi:hypothetical protein